LRVRMSLSLLKKFPMPIKCNYKHHARLDEKITVYLDLSRFLKYGNLIFFGIMVIIAKVLQIIKTAKL